MRSHNFIKTIHCMVSKPMVLIALAFVFNSYSQKDGTLKVANFAQDQNAILQHPQIKWEKGSLMGAIDNGHAIGVVSGTGKLDCDVGGGKLKGYVTAANGACFYSNVSNDTTTSECLVGDCMWNVGAIFGIMANGRALGVIKGTGKLDVNIGGKEFKGDVTADGHGGCNYSNVANDTTKYEYWDGFRKWNAGAIIGVTNKGKSIGIIIGKGKLDYFEAGAHVTGDVTANGKGEFVYSNVSNGTTTGEYWDGVKTWKTGAILGITKSNNIGVISGTSKSE
jgi:hypothetical protein